MYSGYWCVPMWGGTLRLGDGNTQLMGCGWGGWWDLSINHWQFWDWSVHSALIKCWGHPSADPRTLIPVTLLAVKTANQSLFHLSITFYFAYHVLCHDYCVNLTTRGPFVPENELSSKDWAWLDYIPLLLVNKAEYITAPQLVVLVWEPRSYYIRQDWG